MLTPFGFFENCQAFYSIKAVTTLLVAHHGCTKTKISDIWGLAAKRMQIEYQIIADTKALLSVLELGQHL